MHDGTRRIARSLSAAAALAAVLAVLVQAVATIPLALQLAAAASLDAAFAAFPLCGRNADDRQDNDGRTGDGHEHCLAFCHGAFGTAILPGPLSMLAGAIFAAVVSFFSPTAHNAIERIAGYSSRGPPFAVS